MSCMRHVCTGRMRVSPQTQQLCKATAQHWCHPVHTSGVPQDWAIDTAVKHPQFGCLCSEDRQVHCSAEGGSALMKHLLGPSDACVLLPHLSLTPRGTQLHSICHCEIDQCIGIRHLPEPTLPILCGTAGWPVCEWPVCEWPVCE